MKTSSHARASRGVSLIEACIVVAIIAIVGATALPNFAASLEARRLEGASIELVGSLRLARSEAVARNTPVRFSISRPGGSACYVVHTGAAAQCRCDGVGLATCSGDAREIKTVVLPSAERIDLQANVASMAFDPLHGTTTPTGTLRLIDGRGRAVHHIVNVMGRVRTCSPLSQMPAYRAC